jgi:hypothetical protein
MVQSYLLSKSQAPTKTKKKGDGGMAQVLPSKFRALRSNPNITKKTKKEKKKPEK